MLTKTKNKEEPIDAARAAAHSSQISSLPPHVQRGPIFFHMSMSLAVACFLPLVFYLKPPSRFAVDLGPALFASARTSLSLRLTDANMRRTRRSSMVLSTNQLACVEDAFPIITLTMAGPIARIGGGGATAAVCAALQ